MGIELAPLSSPIGADLFLSDNFAALRSLGPAHILHHQCQCTVDVPLVECGVRLLNKGLSVCHTTSYNACYTLGFRYPASPHLAPLSPFTMSCSDDANEPSSNKLINSFLSLRISCEKRVTASVCSGWLSEKSSAKSTEDKRQRRMSQNNGPSTVDFITPSLRTIPRHSIPRYCRAIKRCSCVRCNLAVIGTIWPVIDVTATGAVQPLVVVPPPNTFEAIDFMTDSSKPSH